MGRNKTTLWEAKLSILYPFPKELRVEYLQFVARHHAAWLCWRKAHSEALTQREMGSRTARQKDTCGACVHPAHALLPETEGVGANLRFLKSHCKLDA